MLRGGHKFCGLMM